MEDTPYSTVRAGVTIASAMKPWTNGKLTGGVRRVSINGQPAFSIAGRFNERGETVIRADRRRAQQVRTLLPLVVVLTTKHGMTGRETFSHWGEDVTLTPPKLYAICPAIFLRARPA